MAKYLSEEQIKQLLIDADVSDWILHYDHRIQTLLNLAVSTAIEQVGYVSALPIKTPQTIRSDANDVFKLPLYTVKEIS